MSSSFDKSKKILKRKRTSNFCSTPVVTEANRLSSISISAVDTNSSSSAKTVNKAVKRRTIETKKKTRRKKQRRKTKRKSKKDSDSDWETKSEQSVYDETLLHSFSKQPISDSDNVLFMDVRSPEHVRDAPRLVADRLESPILRSNQWQIESPRKISFGEKKDTLPLKELPFLVSPFDDSDEEEQPLFLKRDNVVKTYLGIRNPRHSKKHVSIEKCKQWLIDVKVPTTSSDLLWDNFVQNNYKKISKYLATSSNYKQISSHQRKSGETRKDKDNDLNAVTNEEEKRWKGNFQLQKKLSVVRGHWDKSLGKWSRAYDEYDFPAHEDVEFGGNSGTARRMELNQFLHKCKTEKEKVTENLSPLRSPQSNVERDSNGTRNKRTLECSEFKSKRSRTMAADVSDSELQRIYELRKFASRLSTKEKSFSNEASLDETTTTSRLPSLKRVKKHENVMKSQSKTAKNKPTIKTVEILSTVRYSKKKKAWEPI